MGPSAFIVLGWIGLMMTYFRDIHAYQCSSESLSATSVSMRLQTEQNQTGSRWALTHGALCHSLDNCGCSIFKKKKVALNPRAPEVYKA